MLFQKPACKDLMKSPACLKGGLFVWNINNMLIIRFLLNIAILSGNFIYGNKTFLVKRRYKEASCNFLLFNNNCFMYKKFFFTIIIACFLFSVVKAQSLITYPKPQGISSSRLYQVTVSQNNVSRNSFVYVSNAGNVPSTFLNYQLGKTFNFSVFSFTGAVRIKITKVGSSANYAVVRPNRVMIGKLSCIKSAGNTTVSFTLAKPGKFSVEFDDDTSYNDPLMIFADSLEDPANVPGKLAGNTFLATDSVSLKNIPANKNIVYLQPGVIDIGHFRVPPQVTQIYIAGGAFVRGYIYGDRRNGQSLMINGRGVLSQDIYPFHYPDTNPANTSSRFWYKAIEINGGSGHYIEGITLIDGSAYYINLNANNAIIDNVNVNGFKFNNDAFTLTGNYISVKRCFIRDNEDAIVLYSSNLTINNCVFWQLKNTIIQLGWRPHSMKNNSISNCDVLHIEWSKPADENSGFITAMNALKTDNQQASIIENFTISDIYFDTPIEKFIDIGGDRKWGKKNKNAYTANDQPWVYKDFTFKNLHFQNNNGTGNLFHLNGFSPDNPISNFNFSKIFMNGTKVSDERIFNNTFLNKKNAVNLKLLSN